MKIQFLSLALQVPKILAQEIGATVGSARVIPISINSRFLEIMDPLRS
jgi:hypothetical protein